MTDESAAEGPLNTISTPEQLALAREQRGFVRPDVAQRLKLHPRQLEAIERGDWSALPGRAFARGAVRSYGRLLGVDVEPLLQSIGGYNESEALKPQATLAAPMPRGGAFGFDGEGRSSRWPWAVLGVIGVIAVALFFGNDGDVSRVGSWIGGAEERPAATAPAGSGAPGAAPTDPSTGSGPAAGASGGAPGVLPPLVPPPLVPPAPGVPAQPAAGAPGTAPGATTGGAAVPGPLVPPPLVPPAGSAGGTAPGAPSSAPAAPPSAGAATPPASAASAPVRVTARQDAWVDVRQADGKSVFMGTVKAGTPLEVGGTAPFSLTIGNADQVAVEYEGRAVPVKPATSNIARIKLP